MLRFIKRFVRRNPLQSFLILFNTGVFAWLQTTGIMIANRIGFSGDMVSLTVPDWIKALGHQSLESVQNFYGSSGWAWLITSMLLTCLLSFLRGVFKMILSILLIVLGLWLIFRYYHHLQGILW